MASCRERLVLALLEAPPNLLRPVSAPGALGRGHKYAVDAVAREYHEQVEPRSDWPRARRKVDRMRRRCEAETRMWQKYLSKSGGFDPGVEVYLWYFEDVGGVQVDGAEEGGEAVDDGGGGAGADGRREERVGWWEVVCLECFCFVSRFSTAGGRRSFVSKREEFRLTR